MYTDLQVPRYLRSTALCVVLLMGATPAVTLACEWACAPATDQAHEHSHHHGAGSTEAQNTPAGPSLGASHTPCDHAGDVMAAVTGGSVKAFAPAIAPAAAQDSAVLTSVTHKTAAAMALSPPGVRPRPLSLRI